MHMYNIHIPKTSVICDNVKDEYVKDEYVKDEYVKDEYVKDEYVKDEYVKDEYVKDEYVMAISSLFPIFLSNNSSVSRTSIIFKDMKLYE